MPDLFFKKNYLTIVFCLLSAAIIACGIVFDSKIIFIIGTVAAIGCYIFIRKNLKEYVRKL